MKRSAAGTSLLTFACVALPHFSAHAGVPFSERITNLTNIDLTISNYGHFGNNFRNRDSSMEFPTDSGHEHLVHGGLWVGALALASEGGLDTLVTTAADNSLVAPSPGSGTEFAPDVPASWLCRASQPRS